jgi:hypothetical protein
MEDGDDDDEGEDVGAVVLVHFQHRLAEKTGGAELMSTSRDVRFSGIVGDQVRSARQRAPAGYAVDRRCLRHNKEVRTARPIGRH